MHARIKLTVSFLLLNKKSVYKYEIYGLYTPLGNDFYSSLSPAVSILFSLVLLHGNALALLTLLIPTIGMPPYQINPRFFVVT